MNTNPHFINKSRLNINGRLLYTEHYNNYKHRPTLVFLHDSLGCVQLWRDFPEKLAAAARCNLLIYDREGYGQSAPMSSYRRSNHYLELEADILQQLLTSLNIQNAILFGHSDGGTIALLAASKYPEHIKAIICEAAHIFVEGITLDGIQATIQAFQTTDLPLRLAKYHGNKVETLYRAWTETWTSNDYRTWNIEHVLPQITCPLLFIQGEDDEYGSLEQVERTITQVGGVAKKHIIPGIGHTPHKSVADEVLLASVTFLQDLDL